MGGRPVLCLNLVGWPVEDLPLETLSSVLQGGADVAASAGALVVGGHNIDDREPKYGMAVVGFADPTRLLRNDAAAPGDALFLTKPLGTGVISTALKRGEAPAVVVASAVETMTTLNAGASKAAVDAGVVAATDVTGFGLLGHLHRMLEASGVSAVVDAGAVPMIDGAEPLAAAGFIAGGTRRNMAYVDPWTTYASEVPDARRVLLADAQTSGGLLLACPPDRAAALPGHHIGTVEPGEPGRITIQP
jgi:selenide,water dikinase